MLVSVIALVAIGGGVSSSVAAPTNSANQAQPASCDRNLGNSGPNRPKDGACTQATEPELIWQGRIQLGDEPGVYADAFFPGLTMELPITLEQTSAPGADTTTLVLQTQDVQTFAGYPGHPITVFIYVPDPSQPPFHSKQVVLTRTTLTSADNNRKEIPINLARFKSPYYISVRVQVDTVVPPGLLDDFVVTRLSNVSTNFRFIASFGFLPPPAD